MAQKVPRGPGCWSFPSPEVKEMDGNPPVVQSPQQPTCNRESGREEKSDINEGTGLKSVQTREEARKTDRQEERRDQQWKG